MPEIIDLLLAFSSQIGYVGIVLLMTIESSFIPFPSEIVIPPAGYLAAKGEMNLLFVILAGLIGSLLGAIINYVLARSLGRTIVYSCIRHRYAKILLLSEAKLEQAEEYFRKYGGISTFVGRLIPAVRQLISIPAGFSKMRLGRFLFYTTLGAGSWTIILALLGYFFGANMDIILKYMDDFKHVMYALIAIAFISAIIFFIIRQKKRRRTNIENDSENFPHQTN